METPNVKEETIIHDRSRDSTEGLKDDKISMSTAQLRKKSMTNEIELTQRAYLEVFGIQELPIGFELSNRRMIIGRGKECDLRLPIDGISRNHARISFRNEEYFIEDLESTNGTYVNSIKILKCVLRNNDQIEIGDAKIIFIEEITRKKSQ